MMLLHPQENNQPLDRLRRQFDKQKREMTRSREWYGAFPDWGPLAEYSATKLKRSQRNLCTVYGVLSPFYPVAEICARLAGNLCQ
jgi:hypothetical protein